MRPELQRYIKIYRKLQDESLSDDKLNDLEEKLENLYYDLTDEEISYVETLDEQDDDFDE